MIKAMVLVVDDVELNRSLLATYIAKLGHEAQMAENGRVALDLMRQRKPDLVLLDIMMPEMDGIELLKVMKADHELRNLPVIMISAVDDLNTVATCIQDGADDYLLKPFNPALLQARICACLEKKWYHDMEVDYRRRLEEANRQIERQVVELRESNALKDKFLSIANHDIRNPLAVIFSCLYVLQQENPEDPLTPDQQRHFYGVMGDSAQQIQAIVSDFLDFRKIQSGTLEMDLAETDLNQAVAEIVRGAEATASRKGIRIALELAEGLPLACADRNRLRQVAMNLLSNAVKYSPREGSVTVRTSPHGGRVRVEVRDRGVGVPASQRQLLFTEFPGISNQPTGGEKSIGLGLAIARRLAEAQGGEMGAEFPDDGGSVFWFELPVSSATTREGVCPSSPAPSR